MPTRQPLPPGFFKPASGGRPRREARDAAIFLAKIYRQQDHQQSSTAAELWIVDAWEKAGTVASKGIGEPAHVRAAIKRARTRGLDVSLVMRFDGLNSASVWTAVEGDSTHRNIPLEGARAWCWTAGMTEAQEARVRNPKMGDEPAPMPSAVATAIQYLMHGQS